MDKDKDASDVKEISDWLQLAASKLLLLTVHDSKPWKRHLAEAYTQVRAAANLVERADSKRLGRRGST